MRAIQAAVLNEIRNSQTLPQTILDVGFGDGVFSHAVSAAFPNSDVTATDTIIPPTLSAGGITWIKGSVEQLPFVSESFDLVIVVLSMHHWKNKEKGIREITRVLKKGGRLIVGDPLLEDWMGNRILGGFMQALDGGVFTDEKRIREAWTQAGLKNIEIRLVPHTMKTLYLITAIK